LVDFTFDQKDIDDKIYELMVAGHKVVIAHPERYKVDELFEHIKKWRKTGAVIQVDAMSFNMKKSRKVCKQLLKERLIDVIASDAHRNEESYTEFTKVLQYIEKKTDKEYVDLITKINPEKIIFGK
jgi:protein-tyrosine phosphatase